MKRGPFAKSMLTMMAVGLVLSVAGYAMGGSTAVYWDHGTPRGVTRDPVNLSVAESIQFTELDVHTSMADVRVVSGSAFSVDAQYETGEPGYELDGNVLRVYDSGTENIMSISGIGFYGGSANKMTVTVPRDVKLERINVRGDVGDLQLRNLSASAMSAAASTGKVEMWDCSTDQLTVYADTGSVYLNNSQAVRAELKTGVGGIHLSDVETVEALTAVSSVGSVKGSADLSGDISVRSDVGSIDLVLAQSRAQYDVDAKADIGAVKISPELTNPTDAPNRLNLRSGTGSITIKFHD